MTPVDHDTVDETRPRLGFVGLGSAGRDHLAALAASGAVEVTALCDPDPERLCAAVPDHRRAHCFDDAAELLDTAGELELDGVVVATPPAAGMEPIGLTVAALERGLAVFCPALLTADAAGCRRAVATARRADRLLGVDYTYRALPGVARAVRRVGAGLLGPLMHVRGAVHGPSGPGAAGRRDAAGAGGGAFLDLGVHLLDLTLALLGQPKVESVAARCFRGGRPLTPPVTEVEDFAAVRVEFAGGPSADLVASWSAHAGAGRVFQLEAFGARGGLELVRRDGASDEFELAVREGRRRTVVARAGEVDRGAAPVAWARRLARSPRFDPAAAGSVAVAEAIERVYGRRAERSSKPLGSGSAAIGALVSA
jgi:predicted dehydrogenase